MIVYLSTVVEHQDWNCKSPESDGGIEFDVHSWMITLVTIDPDCPAGDIIIDLCTGQLNTFVTFNGYDSAIGIHPFRLRMQRSVLTKMSLDIAVTEPTVNLGCRKTLPLAGVPWSLNLVS